jgi:hypothetical protein
MPAEEPSIRSVQQQVEAGALSEALETLRGLAQEHYPSLLNAVSLQKSELSSIEREELELGSDTALRERRNRLKRQLLKLANAINGRMSAQAELEPPTAGDTFAPPFPKPRGEGPVNLLLLYAQEDQDGAEELKKSMALLRYLKRIELFAQHEVPHGKREAALKTALEEAEIVLLLISNEFLASAECLQLQEQAYRLQQQNRLALVPILYGPAAHLDQLPIGQLQALPRDGQPISAWPDEDAAYAGISRELGQLVDSIRQQLDYSQDAVKKASEPPRPGKHEGIAYDRTALIKLFRDGNTERLIQELISITEPHPSFFKRALLLEQQWKSLKSDRINATAMPAELDVRRNQLNEALLALLTEMG